MWGKKNKKEKKKEKNAYKEHKLKLSMLLL